jgi:hypothetical protein
MSSLPLSYNIRNLIVRWQVTLLAIGGIALVVAVMLVLVAISNGFRMALRTTGSPENVMVVQRSAAVGAERRLQPRIGEPDHGRPPDRPRCAGPGARLA